jgi:hypothetical protein
MVKVTPDHDYNEPGLSATDFLYRVMRNQTVPLSQRVEAATYLLRLPPPPTPVVTIKIEGGMPEPADPDLLARYPVLRLVQ